jgi:hypothetical protein
MHRAHYFDYSLYCNSIFFSCFSSKLNYCVIVCRVIRFTCASLTGNEIYGVAFWMRIFAKVAIGRSRITSLMTCVVPLWQPLFRSPRQQPQSIIRSRNLIFSPQKFQSEMKKINFQEILSKLEELLISSCSFSDNDMF